MAIWFAFLWGEAARVGWSREVLDEKWGREDKQNQRDNENRSREEEEKQLKKWSIAYRYPLYGIFLYGADMCFKAKCNCIYVY